MPESEPSSYISVPRVLVIALAISMPTMAATGAWFVASQASVVTHLASSQVRMLAEHETYKLRQENVNQALAEATARIDLRLTRIEAQLAFLVSTAPISPRR